MSQLWASTALGQAIATILTNLSDKADTLRTLNSGASAPGSPVAGMLWLDTTGPTVFPLKQRNQANSAWVTIIPDCALANGGLLALSGGTLSGALAMGSQKITGLGSGTAATDAINKGQADGRILSAPVFIGTQSATNNVYIFITQAVECAIVDVEIASELGVAADGANKWTFQVRDITGALDLLSAVKDTSAAAITADAVYALGVNQNNTALAAGKLLRITMTKTGAPNALTEAVVVLKYKVTTP